LRWARQGRRWLWWCCHDTVATPWLTCRWMSLLLLLQIPTSAGSDPRFEYPKLVAVPLFDLYDNPGRYGPVLASLPALLSRQDDAITLNCYCCYLWDIIRKSMYVCLFLQPWSLCPCLKIDRFRLNLIGAALPPTVVPKQQQKEEEQNIRY